ncbi:MAG: Nramp family divalent metal transporter [Kiritimatiellia bacterium]
MQTVEVKQRNSFRRLLAFMGPAYLISIGYMDPGNWATDIAGGAQFGYALLWVLLFASLMAVLLQTLAARLGIVTGYDLAQGCRREYPRLVSLALWALTEIAIAATDLAEIIGTVIGLNLLFGLPLLWGCAVCVFDTFLLLAIQRLGVRRMEAFILMLVGTIAACFVIEVLLARPDWGAVAAGLRPSLPHGALYIAIGIIGATVMPHNLFLHSSLVQTRAIDRTFTGRSEACRFNLIDSLVALNGAFLVNAAILIMSAANFHSRGIVVTEIQQAHEMLDRLLGGSVAPMVFGIALLAAGQSSTLTGTISGQVVMEGFLNIRLQPWVRRMLTRCVALVPAVAVIAISGNGGIYQLLILSQVILSLQLPFAVIPLIHFTSQREKMGVFVSPRWLQFLAWCVAGVIVFLNGWLIVQSLGGSLATQPPAVRYAAMLVAGALASLLVYLFLSPWRSKRQVWENGVIANGNAVVARLQTPPLRRLGVALDHGPGDAEALSMAVMLARKHDARLALIHVVESPGGMVYGATSDSLHGRQDQVYVEGIAREIETPSLPVDVVVRSGATVETLVALSQELGLDLLVMGAHGHTGWQDLVFGETVHGVRHALTIPVVVVKHGG